MDHSKPTPQEPPLTLGPARAWPPLGLAELWRYRSLAAFLAWRDIKLQFKQTALGAAWAILQPLALAGVFSLVFGLLFDFQTGSLPYLLFFFSGMVAWTLFSQTLQGSAQAVVGDAHLIQKIYFPRLVLPLAAAAPPLFDAAFAGLVLLGIGLAYGYPPRWSWLLAPLILALAPLMGLAVGLWFCAFNVRFRDTRYLLPLTTTIWMYLTPVFYDLRMVPERARPAFALNPLVGCLDGLRWALFGAPPPSLAALASALILPPLLLIAGAFYFRRCEETFADEL